MAAGTTATVRPNSRLYCHFRRLFVGCSTRLPAHPVAAQLPCSNPRLPGRRTRKSCLRYRECVCSLPFKAAALTAALLGTKWVVKWCNQSTKALSTPEPQTSRRAQQRKPVNQRSNMTATRRTPQLSQQTNRIHPPTQHASNMHTKAEPRVASMHAKAEAFLRELQAGHRQAQPAADGRAQAQHANHSSEEESNSAVGSARQCGLYHGMPLYRLGDMAMDSYWRRRGSGYHPRELLV